MSRLRNPQENGFSAQNAKSGQNMLVLGLIKNSAVSYVSFVLSSM